MRTPLNVDDQLLERAWALSRKPYTPVKKVMAPRAGLERVEKPADQRP